MTRVCVITNAASGHNRKWRARVSEELSRFPGLAHHVTRTEAEATDLIARMASDIPDVIVMNGGDGTVAALIGRMLHHWPKGALPLMIVLPGGTANMTAGDVGIATSA